MAFRASRLRIAPDVRAALGRIARRLSTIRNAIAIIVIEEAGRIVARGTHDALLEKNGLYAELHRRQFREPLPKTA